MDLEALYFDIGKSGLEPFIKRIKTSYNLIAKRFLNYYNEKALEQAKQTVYLYKTWQLKHIIYRTLGTIRNVNSEIEKFENLYLLGNHSTCENSDNPPHQITIPAETIQALEQAGYTDTNNKWIGQKNLCAYFVDKYFKAQHNKWAIGEKIFGVKNLVQLKDLYENTKNGLPRNHKIIDDILQ